MANRPSAQARSSSTDGPACAPAAGLPIFTEPEVHRWPHPVDGGSPPACSPVPGGQTDPALTYLHCALSHQNQLLMEIRSLLEHLAADSPRESEEK